MTEKPWLKDNDPRDLQRLLNNASERKIRLLASAYLRGQWDSLNDPRLRYAIEVMERYADGRADESERRAARLAAYAATNACESAGRHNLARNVFDITFHDPAVTLWLLNPSISSYTSLVRDLFGNPFHLITISSAWLSWNDGIVVRLAQAAYDERILPAGTLDNTRLFILADALEEAGCSDEQILRHLRNGGEHYRGCFVLDALLGRS